VIAAIWTAVSNLLSAASAALGLAQSREQRRNSPEQQRAAQGQADQDIRDAANRAAAARDLDAIRKLNS
jgi:hypothetical protein